MNNPFSDDIRKVYSRFNPFKPKTKEETLQEKQTKLSQLETLKELSEVSEQLSSDSRYIKLRKLRQEQLTHNIEILKTIKSTDPEIARVQGRVQTLEEELNMNKVIKQRMENIESESRT